MTKGTMQQTNLQTKEQKDKHAEPQNNGTTLNTHIQKSATRKKKKTKKKKTELDYKI